MATKKRVVKKTTASKGVKCFKVSSAKPSGFYPWESGEVESLMNETIKKNKIDPSKIIFIWPTSYSSLLIITSC